MTKAEIINMLATKTGHKRAHVANWVEAVLCSIQVALDNGEDVILQKFGAFRVRTARPRKARNHVTGETVNVPERKKIVFSPSRELLR